jgi:hypothetical protein
MQCNMMLNIFLKLFNRSKLNMYLLKEFKKEWNIIQLKNKIFYLHNNNNNKHRYYLHHSISNHSIPNHKYKESNNK